MKLKTYYWLTKPGIVYGNIITTIAGYLFASHDHLYYPLFYAVVIGTALVIASACVFNNFIDRDIDIKMERTSKRALVSGALSPQSALIFASIIGIIGFLTLALWVNSVTVIVGLIGFIDYVILYGLAKRRSIHSTIIGSVSGASPIVAGYTAISNRIDGAAALLFLILVIWQMPHFYSIAVYRLKEYKAARLPVLPVKNGVDAAKLQIILYVVGFVIATTLMAVLGYASPYFSIVIGLFGLFWLRVGLKGYKTNDNNSWARKMFKISLIVTLALSLMLSINAYLPS